MDAIRVGSGEGPGQHRQEYICEETGDEVVLMKDADGHVIGFEKLDFFLPDLESLKVSAETAPA